MVFTLVWINCNMHTSMVTTLYHTVLNVYLSVCIPNIMMVWFVMDMLQYANTFRYDTLPNCNGIYGFVLYTHRQIHILLQFAYGLVQANIRWFYMPKTYRPLVIYISTNSYVIIFWIRSTVREYSAIWYIENWVFACKTTAAFSISICGFHHNTCKIFAVVIICEQQYWSKSVAMSSKWNI